MSSKNAESSQAGGRERRAFAHPSIRARLTLLYTLSAFGMMAAVTAFQDWVLIRGLERDETQVILDKVQMLEATLRFHADDPAFLEHEVNLEGGEYQRVQYYALYARILDEQGQVVIETPGMISSVPISAFPNPVMADALTETETIPRWESPDDRSYHLIAVGTHSGGDGGPRRVIQVALDDTGERALISEYRRDTLLALALGTLVFGALASVIARKGLQPVADLARTAERVKASTITSRIDANTSRWPEELTGLADAIYRMLSRLEESFGRISQFSADLAHELRTPLHNLMGEAEVALSRTRTPEEYQQILASSLEEYARLTRLINELLFLAWADNPESEIEWSEFEARQEIEAVLEFHEAQAQEQGIDVQCHGQAALCADRRLFRRAMSNLVSNALRHTPGGGCIRVLARQNESGWVEVAVCDTGRGVAANDLPRLCDRFFSTAKPRSSDHREGVGLGLAIVKSIMALHGGAIDIQSQQGEGTKVQLLFPQRPPQAREGALPGFA